MTALRFDDLKQYSDVLRSRSGDSVTVRFVEPGDGEALQNYYRSLSARSRYNRFLGGMSELPRSLLEHFTHIGEDEGFTVIATMTVDGSETIVGEARDPVWRNVFPRDVAVAFRLRGAQLGGALWRRADSSSRAYCSYL